MRFDAFLSYSHAADGKLAPAVQSALHRLARPWYRLRSLWVFRDKTSLSATPSLWPSIEKALSESEYFLLMASPEAAISHWVQQEVDWWIAHRSPLNILILVTDGEICWPKGSEDFDWRRTTALPPNLRSQFSHEPLWVDLRWARTEESLSLRHVQFRGAVLDIAATIKKQPKDVLDGDDVRIYRRNRSAAYIAIITTLALAVAATYGGLRALRERDLATANAERANNEAAKALSNAALADRNAKTAETRRTEAVAAEHAAEEQTRIATSRALGSASLLIKDTQTDLASLLGLEAARMADTFEARNAVFSTYQTNPRLLKYLYHPSPVETVTFSPEGTLLATVTADGIIRLWNTASGKVSGQPISIGRNRVAGIAFSRDGKRLASGGADGTVRVWASATHKLLAESIRTGGGPIVDVAFSADDKMLISGSLNGSLNFWDGKTLKFLQNPVEKQLEGLNEIALSPDGRLLAAANMSGSVLLVELESGQTVKLANKNAGPITGLAFSGDSRFLASSLDHPGVIHLWDMESRQALPDLPVVDGSSLHGLAFSSDGKLAVASEQGNVQMWRVNDWKPITSPLRAHRGAVNAVAFSADGKTLASASQDMTVLLWDPESEPPLGQRLRQRTGAMDSLAFSGDGKLLASAGGQRGHFMLWEVNSRRSVREVEPRTQPTPVSMYASSSSSALAFDAKAKMLAAGDFGGNIYLWNVTTGHSLGDIVRASKSAITGVAFNPTGTVLASCSSDGTLRLWKVLSGHPAGGQRQGPQHASAVTFSANGKMLAAADHEGRVFLWNLAQLRPLATLEGGRGATFNEISGTPLSNIDFSDDGTLIASGGADGRIRIWDVGTRRILGEPLDDRSGAVMAVRFSPNGSMLATGTVRGTVQLWDVASRQPFGAPLQTFGSVSTMAFSHDGRYLAWGALSGYILIANVSLTSQVARLCALANRDLTTAEWEQYVGSAAPYHVTCSNTQANPNPTTLP
jgi:WD40 repeat protein